MPLLATSYELPAALFMLFAATSPLYPGLIVAIAGGVMLARKRAGAWFILGTGLVALGIGAFVAQRQFGGQSRPEDYMQDAYLRMWTQPLILAALTWHVAQRTRDRVVLVLAAAYLLMFLHPLVSFLLHADMRGAPNLILASVAGIAPLVIVLVWTLLAIRGKAPGEVTPGLDR